MTDELEYAHDYGINPKTRELFLFGREEFAWRSDDDSEPGIEYALANQFIKNVRMLTGDAPILIHMKTNGGHWHEGMAIYNAIKYCPAHVTILSYTHARSMSSIIFQAADYRVMMPDSIFMAHRGTIAFDGTVTQFETEYQQCQIEDARMMEIYVDSMRRSDRFVGMDDASISEWLKEQMRQREEVYFSAEQAVELGLADAVFDGDWDRLKHD